MKRVLSLVLALVLVLGMMPTFAASATGAEQLKAYGFVSGGDNGDLMVDKTLTRGELAVILTDLYGQKDQAAGTVFPANFTDVNDHWSRPYVAYAQESGWVSGYPDGTYKPEGTVTSQELAAAILKVLGYDVPWGEVVDFAATQGINVGSDSALTRGEAFESLWQTVNTPKQGAEVSLGVELGKLEDGTPAAGDLAVESLYSDNLKQINVEFNQAVDKDSAIDKANYTLKDNKDKKLTSATAISNIDLDADGKTVVITLANKAEQQDTYKVAVADVKTADESKTVVKSEKEIQFVDTQLPKILNAEVAGSNTIKVTFSEPMNIADKTAVKKAFNVNDGKYYVKDVTGQKNDTELLVTLYTTLKAGDLPFQVTTDIKDFAGFSAIGETYNLTVVEDTTAPVVTGFKSATRTEVVLVWSEDIEFNDSKLENFYHTNSSNQPDSDYKDKDNNTVTITKLSTLEDYPELNPIDGNELTLSFADHKLAPGSAYVYVMKDSVKDLWGNKNTQQMTSVEVDVDKTAPELTTIEYTDTNKVKLTFNEKVNTNDVTEKDDITLLDNEGKEVDARATVSDVDASKSFVITFKADDDLDGDYSLVIEGVKDTSDNEMVKDTIPFTAVDKVAPSFPKVENVTLNKLDGGNTFVINIGYGERMATEGRYSVLDLNNYVLKAAGKTVQLGKIDSVTANLINEGKAVEIRMPKDDNDVLGENSDVAYGDLQAGTLTIARVADDSDNVTVALSSSDYTLVDKATSKVEITKVEITDPYKVKITLDSDLSQGNFDKDDFTLYDGKATTDAAKKLTVESVEPTFDGTKTVVVFNLGDKYDATSAGAFNGFSGTAIKADRVLTIVTPVADANNSNSYNVYTNYVKQYNDTVLTPREIDKAAPALVTGKLNGTDTEDDVRVYTFASENPTTDDTIYRNFVVLSFNENIDSSSLSTTTFEVDDQTVTKAVVTDSISGLSSVDDFDGLTNPADGGSYVVLTLATDKVVDEDTSVTLKSPIYDLAGSSVSDHNALSTLDTAINKVEGPTLDAELIIPMLTSIQTSDATFGDADNDTIALTYDNTIVLKWSGAEPTLAEVNALLGTELAGGVYTAALSDAGSATNNVLTITATTAPTSGSISKGDVMNVNSVSTVVNTLSENPVNAKAAKDDVTVQ